MVLEAAVNGQAHAIVTFNRRDFNPAIEKFGIEVLSPGAPVERLKGPCVESVNAAGAAPAIFGTRRDPQALTAPPACALHQPSEAL